MTTPSRDERSIVRRLRVVHAALETCHACPGVEGPVVHGPAIASSIVLVGQAPGAHEGAAQRPFAWTAGRTLFRWFERALGASESEVRERIYFAAVARCFPGRSRGGGGDRRPDAHEIASCRVHLEREISVLRPGLVLAVGGLAIEQVLGTKQPLDTIVGSVRRVAYHGHPTDVIALPHPSGVSPWHKLEPGRSLLEGALAAFAAHPVTQRAFAPR